MANNIFKNTGSKNNNNSQNFEILKNEYETFSPKAEKKPFFSLGGILRLGEPMKLGEKSAEKKPFFSFNYLEQEQKTLINYSQETTAKEIKELKRTIKQLYLATKSLDKEIEKLIEKPTIEINTYQLNFLERVKILLDNFSKNVSEASHWVNSFSSRKNKRGNIFLNNTKKHGSEYSNSAERNIAFAG